MMTEKVGAIFLDRDGVINENRADHVKSWDEFEFIPGALAKLGEVRRRIDASGRDIRLEIDGGVKADNIGQIARAGADTFVAGSAIFGQKDYRAVIGEMRRNIDSALAVRA